jgi:hypothetical protein
MCVCVCARARARVRACVMGFFEGTCDMGSLLICYMGSLLICCRHVALLQLNRKVPLLHVWQARCLYAGSHKSEAERQIERLGDKGSESG